jgi:hypothetical protein
MQHQEASELILRWKLTNAGCDLKTHPFMLMNLRYSAMQTPAVAFVELESSYQKAKKEVNSSMIIIPYDLNDG